VEFASNLVWLITALSMLAFIYHGVRAGSVRISMASAMMLAFVLSIILLPVISVSDDLLSARQAPLPSSEQTWKLAFHDASFCESTLIVFAAYLLMLLALQPQRWEPRRAAPALPLIVARLVRAQRLRPPPALA